MSKHILFVEAGAACQPASLEFLLQERLPGELSAGQKAHWGAHTAALQLLHFHRARIRPALLLFSPLHPGHLLALWGRGGALLGLHYGDTPLPARLPADVDVISYLCLLASPSRSFLLRWRRTSLSPWLSLGISSQDFSPFNSQLTFYH